MTPKLRVEIRNFRCQQADPRDPRDTDPVQQNETAPLHGLGGFNGLEQPPLIHLQPSHQPCEPVVPIHPSCQIPSLPPFTI
jgi:hypothetical protein